ncbi:DNA adenine methylase [Akkermansia muciniphila]|uniref:DNA adenine methylase n=1 Tax=Akkermansia muciniphila TaxID=239935 RepID=UPI000C9C0AD8|nr:Dam family site-specific DNA-(adenine-N6)-methyltransferase [Akkermansia muciniphila]PNC05833.1 DNA adenine methylase [Akkermansia muciniphila]
MKIHQSQPKDHFPEENVAKPFLRWAGGKSWIVKYLRPLLSECSFVNYHEPFLGGGSVFFSLTHHGRIFLSDSNRELIETYLSIRDNVDEIISLLRKYPNEKDFYYNLRDSSPPSLVEKSARFIYLNQTSFNGIYRVNLKGKYNVPYGYRNKIVLNENVLRKASAKLQGAELMCCDFESTLSRIEKGDLIFIDPPYTISHNNNGFIKYNQKIFSLEDQYRLSNLIDKIKLKKAFYVLTNAAHSKISEIFNKGDLLIQVNRANLLGGKNAQRGHVDEFLFTNIVR